MNYQIHKGFNRTKRMEIGILRIGFVDRDRAAISEEVLWKDEGKARFQREQVDITVVEFPLNEDEADTEPFDPENVSDARNTIMRAIRERRGQQSFRDNLLGAYERRCAISGCEIVDVLEAAHITPYLGPDTNHVTNGLLLRADLHTLMDCGLLVIDPTTYAVVLAPALRAAPDYKGLHGRRLHDPVPISAAPSPKALKEALRGCWWYGAR